MTAHSLLGASAAHRWLSCPGSFALSRREPHRPTSIYAATGTLAHEYIEQAARNGSMHCNESELDQTKTIDGHAVPVTRDLIDGVNVMLDYLQTRRKTWGEVELRVSLDGYFPAGPPVPVFGTLDAAMVNPPWLEIIDYKNGSGVRVNPAENPQLLFYAAGALASGVPEGDKITKARLTIVQPHAGGAPVRSWEISVVDLLMWVDDVLVPGVDACTRPDAPFNAGPWCRFCPVSHACPELHKAAVAAAKTDFAPVDDLDELADALNLAERAELWIDGLRDFALGRLQQQERIPGWGLVPTRPTRKWTQPEQEVKYRLEALGASYSDVFETRLRSPAQMEKHLCRTRSGQKLWKTIEDIVEARSSGVKLGRDHPPREDFTDEI